MKQPDKFKLFSILSMTKVLLNRSKEEGFPAEEPKEAEKMIDEIIDCLYFDSKKSLPEYWSILYAPTGSIQEISIANGWGDAFLKLAGDYDSLEYLLKKYEKENPN